MWLQAQEMLSVISKTKVNLVRSNRPLRLTQLQAQDMLSVISKTEVNLVRSNCPRRNSATAFSTSGEGMVVWASSALSNPFPSGVMSEGRPRNRFSGDLV